VGAEVRGAERADYARAGRAASRLLLRRVSGAFLHFRLPSPPASLSTQGWVPCLSVTSTYRIILLVQCKLGLAGNFTCTGVRYCQSLGLQSLVTCHLNPLQVCSPVVGKTFSSIARCVAILYCSHNVRKVPVTLSHSSIVSLPAMTARLVVVCRSHQIAFCDTVLERNRRLQCFYPSTARSASDQRCIRQLESFFPFDPYLLRR
jgi:hypothetical protein